MQLCLAYRGPHLASLSRGRVLPGLPASTTETTALHACRCAFVHARGFSPIVCQGGWGVGHRGLSRPLVCPLPRLERLSICSHLEFAGDMCACAGMVRAWLVLGGVPPRMWSPVRVGPGRWMDGWMAGESCGSFTVVWGLSMVGGPGLRAVGGFEVVCLGGLTGVPGVMGPPSLSVVVGFLRCLPSGPSRSGALPWRPHSIIAQALPSCWVHTLAICVHNPSRGSPLTLAPPGWCLLTMLWELAFCHAGVAPRSPSPTSEGGGGVPGQSALRWGTVLRGCLLGTCTWEKKRTQLPGRGCSLTSVAWRQGQGSEPHASPPCWALSLLNGHYCDAVMDNLYITSLLYRYCIHPQYTSRFTTHYIIKCKVQVLSYVMFAQCHSPYLLHSRLV